MVRRRWLAGRWDHYASEAAITGRSVDKIPSWDKLFTLVQVQRGQLCFRLGRERPENRFVLNMWNIGRPNAGGFKGPETVNVEQMLEASRVEDVRQLRVGVNKLESMDTANRQIAVVSWCGHVEPLG